MTKILIALALAVSTPAFAAKTLAGSDTLAGVMTDALVELGMQSQLNYVGGGSGEGEKALVAGDQGFAPMSRPLKAEALAAIEAKGLKVNTIELALDGVAMWVKDSSPVQSLDLPTVAGIYNCTITRWEVAAPNSGLRGTIRPFRRDDRSGTTDAFKAFTGLKTFGPCVTDIESTANIADKTSNDPYAIGYAGKSAQTPDNRALALAKLAGGTPVIATDDNVRSLAYPMARKLFIFEVEGASTAEESQFLRSAKRRSFMDKHVQAHEFVTLD